MLPSPRLILLVLAAAPIFLLGAVFDPFAALGVIYVIALAAYAGVDLLLLPRRRHVAIERLVPERISLGAATPIVLQVRNTGWRRMEIRLAENLPDSMDSDPPQCAGVFDPGAAAAMEYRLVARRRGRYHLSPIDVRLLARGGLLVRQFCVDLPAEVHVFPNLVNLQRYELLLRRGLAQEQGLARIRQIGQGTEFESLRQYAQGDDMGRVDWKATAKRSQLITRNYQPEREQNVLLAIDVGRATAGEFQGMSRLDYLVNAALMLAYVALRQGDWFSLVAFSDRIESYLPPIRRVERIERVIRALYELDPRLVQSDYGAACRFLSLHNRKRSLICLMTDVIDRWASEEIIAYLANFARRHLPLAVTLSNPELQAFAEQPLAGPAAPDPYSKAVALDVLAARKEALTAMRHLGVDVLDVHPGALTPELINRYLLIKSARRL
ncbi:MAG TPA: DUF58 domain-containing protein [Phycisphaerae bacterium]|nr:DUF58 domain-containing protein [Phycisphaerae bacterium]